MNAERRNVICRNIVCESLIFPESCMKYFFVLRIDFSHHIMNL